MLIWPTRCIWHVARQDDTPVYFLQVISLSFHYTFKGKYKLSSLILSLEQNSHSPNCLQSRRTALLFQHELRKFPCCLLGTGQRHTRQSVLLQYYFILVSIICFRISFAWEVEADLICSSISFAFSSTSSNSLIWANTSKGFPFSSFLLRKKTHLFSFSFRQYSFDIDCTQ